MNTTSKLRLACVTVLSLLMALVSTSPTRAETEKRIAFVVGNAAYQASPLATAANDAGLIAQTLQAAGFDVSGARDLDGESLRAAFRDFLDKAQASGPGTVAFVYLAGYGLQLEGENYFVPVDAKIASAQDVAVEALRVSDYAKRLAGLPLKASFIVLDAARESPFAKSGPPLAGGLALADAEPNMLLAFNATPGTVAPSEPGPYGAYSRALTEMIRQGGLQPAELFDGVRLRVNEETKGAQVPWDTSRIAAPFVFFERAADAPAPALAADRIDAMRSRPLQDLGSHDAYAAAIERDTLQGYQDFLTAYPNDPLAGRVRALLAARREALTWRRTYSVDTPDAYWSYLDRYPRGPHAADARRRLSTLAAAEEPPPSYAPIVYDVPPPPPPEIVYVDRPVLVFSDPVFDFPLPPPLVFLNPPPPYLVFAPPPPPVELFVLPVPVFVPVPVWINPPVYVAAPANNVIFNNIHNTTIINNNPNVLNPGGPGRAGVAAGVAAGAIAGAAAVRVALPPSVARRAATFGGPGAQQLRPGQPGGPGIIPPGAVPATRLPGHNLPGHELPGATGKPVPGFGRRPGTAPAVSQGAVPSPTAPVGQALPSGGKPMHGLGHHPQNQPGPLPGAHALPGGQQIPVEGSAPKGRRPGANTLPAAGQPPMNRRPGGQFAPRNPAIAPGVNGRPWTPPGPAMAPKSQQLPQHAPQFQQQRGPQPSFQQQRPPQQQGAPQQFRPQPAFQQQRAPQQFQQQQQRPPQAQQQRPIPKALCGVPGAPPCH
ncbi:MAG TPA: caspase family protein [Methylocella sp.]